jgi:hypothetical protein
VDASLGVQMTLCQGQATHYMSLGCRNDTHGSQQESVDGTAREVVGDELLNVSMLSRLF